MSLHFLLIVTTLHNIIRPRFMRQFVAVHSVGVGDSTTLDATASPKIYLFCLMRFQCRSARIVVIYLHPEKIML